MFETIEQTDRRDLKKRLVSFVTSIVAHAAVLVMCLMLPLLFFSVLPEGEILTFLMADPHPPAAPLPPIPPAHITRQHLQMAPPIRGLIRPPAIPRTIPPPAEEVEPPYVALGDVGNAALLQNGLGGLGPKSALSDTLGGRATPPLPPPPPRTPRHPIRVGGDVQQSKLVYRVDPVYPQIAKLARQSGSVILEVNVDEEGNVREVKVLSGNPLLNEAAVSAVMQWKYSPTLLNGEPVPVTATVTVVFALR